MNLNIEEADIDQFGKELKTQLSPSPEEMLTNIKQLEINQDRSMGSTDTIIPPTRAIVVTDLKGLED